jgi:hypothetical protein
MEMGKTTRSLAGNILLLSITSTTPTPDPQLTATQHTIHNIHPSLLPRLHPRPPSPRRPSRPQTALPQAPPRTRRETPTDPAWHRRCQSARVRTLRRGARHALSPRSGRYSTHYGGSDGVYANAPRPLPYLPSETQSPHGSRLVWGLRGLRAADVLYLYAGVFGPFVAGGVGGRDGVWEG